MTSGPIFIAFGLAPLEAIAAGLPARVTRSGGPSESLYDEITGTEYGVRVDPADPRAIAEELLRLVRSPSEWARFRDASRRCAFDRYTWKSTARAYFGPEVVVCHHVILPSAKRRIATAGDPGPPGNTYLGSGYGAEFNRYTLTSGRLKPASR